MTNANQDLSEIRSMMEKSSRVLSLSGLAGIFVGCTALAGLLFAQYIHTRVPENELLSYLIGDAMVVLVAAIALAVYFSSRMARQKALPIWNATAKHLVAELALPLAVGGVFCISLLVHGAYSMLPAAMLIFYGLALFGASKYAVKEVRFLGLTQVVVGVVAAFVDTQGLYLWGLGFGIVHILFGLRIYRTYER
jgi:hypothetical protein